MSKSKKQVRRAAPGAIIASWVGSLLSVGLLYLCAKMVLSDFASFRSCASNNTGLYISSCGKQSINVGDFIFVLLFVASAVLTLSLFTHAWRITRGTSS